MQVHDANTKLKPSLNFRLLRRSSVNVADTSAPTIAVCDDAFLDLAKIADYVDVDDCALLAGVCCMVKKLPSTWQLTNHSQTINCAVNDALLRYGESREIAMGDSIELGLLRLMVSDEIDVDDASSAAFTQREVVAFPTSDMLRKTPHADLDLFDCLPRFAPDDASETQVHTDVITQLAQAYEQAIADPTSLRSQLAIASSMPGTAPHVPTPEQLALQNPAYFSLEDVLSGQLTIDQILARIGPEDTTWNTAVPAEDVLMLFADERSRREQAQLPDITRREHHAISPDSPLSLGRTTK